MIKTWGRQLTPPLIWQAVSKLKNRIFPPPPPPLFDGDNSLFQSILKTTNLYGEYGCGASTLWVLNNTNAKARSVDTSKQWIDLVLASINPECLDRLSTYHADLGDVGKWGRPRNYNSWQKFTDYTDWIWAHDETPDTVLIDGRFRVASFLTCLKYAKEGTKLIFDDYTNRPHYHLVENYVSKSDECGRQALFIVPKSDFIDYIQLEREIANFRYVMD